MLERKHIKFVDIHALFADISLALGFSREQIEQYEDNLGQLVNLWENQQFVEIYADNKDRLFGRAKDSSLAYGASPYYIGLYHARLDYSDNDPLLVLTFDQEDDPEQSRVVIRFMVNHNDFFGAMDEKYNQQRMKAIRKRIDDFISLGN